MSFVCPHCFSSLGARSNVYGTVCSKCGTNMFVVNPQIISYGKKKSKGREGCYSCRPENFDVRGVVERSEKVKVKFLDLDGKENVQEFSGFTSVIMQHEIDHLNGKVFPHRIKNEKDLHIVFDSEYKLHKKNYKKWKRTMSPRLYFKDVCKINQK
jgi:peptide deformylase